MAAGKGDDNPGENSETKEVWENQDGQGQGEGEEDPTQAPSPSPSPSPTPEDVITYIRE